MSNELTIINLKERSGRSYTFEFKSNDEKKVISDMMLTVDHKLLINMIKASKNEEYHKIVSDLKKDKNLSEEDLNTKIKELNKDKYYDLAKIIDYKILGVDHAVDIIAYFIKDDKINIPIIDRKYAPKGFALPGGFIDEGESKMEAAKREFKEELDLNIESEPISETKFYEGKDENGKLYDFRGSITTQGFVFEIPQNSNFASGSDAKGFKILQFDGNNIDNALDELEKLPFAMDRHKELLKEGLSEIYLHNINLEKTIDFN